MLTRYSVATWTVALIATTAPLSAQDYTIVAMSHTSNGIHDIDPATGTILQEYRVPGEWFGEPHEGAISPDGKTVYASIPYKKQVIVLDGATFKPIKIIESEFFSRPLETRSFVRVGQRETTSGDPHGLALNNDATKLYITLEFAELPGIAVYDVKAGKVTKKIDTVVAGNYLQVQPRTDKLYFPTRDDRVLVIDTKTDRILQSIRVQGSPNGVDFAPNGEVWVNANRDGSVSVIDSATDKVVKVVQTKGKGSGRIAVSPDGRLVASTYSNTGDVHIIDATTREVVAVLPVSTGGQGFPLFSPDSTTLFMMNEGPGELSVYDMKSMKEIPRRTPIGGASFGGGLRKRAR
jgi:DNA-binding beta-propeller fold protein YncE